MPYRRTKQTKRPGKLPKLAVPRLPGAPKLRLPGRGKKEGILDEALSGLPRITNETVAEHREEVLSSARKYIYPLQHSKNRIIKISSILFVATVIAFFTYVGLALYKFQSTGGFIYEVTRVIPFPVAKAGPYFVAYENYLFELRHLTHYYTTQQNEDFNDPKTAGHLVQLKKDSLQKVIDDAYVKQLAADNNISVSTREVNEQIALVKSQNRLGTDERMLEDVLKQFWGWSESDFRRELKSQLLAQKVASELDGTVHARAANALAEIRQGKDFAKVAAAVSDDASTKAGGGQYGMAISRNNRDVPPQVVDALFKLQPGEVSDVINTGYTLEIVKLLKKNGDKVEAAHISFQIKDVSHFIKPLREENKPMRFIKV